MYKEKSTPFANSPLYATSQKQKCFFLFQSNILNPKIFSFQNFTPPVINKILNYEAHQFVLFHSRKKPSRLAFFSFSLSVRLLKYAHTGKKYSVKCGNADLRMSESLSLSDSGHRPFNCGFNVHTVLLPSCRSPHRIHDAKHNQCHRQIILVRRYLQHQNNIPKQYYSA